MPAASAAPAASVAPAAAIVELDQHNDLLCKERRIVTQ
jgi:hypothetical protein